MPVTVCPALQTFRQAEMNKPTAILCPHVSVLGPLVPKEITERLVKRFAEIMSLHRAIDVVLPQFCVFPDVPALYLSVYPVTPFEALRNAILQELPGYRPKFSAPTFRLTLAFGSALSQLPELMTRAHAQLDRFLPIETTLRELQLCDRINGVWKTRQTFPLNQ